jgi:hypothetical protein
MQTLYKEIGNKIQDKDIPLNVVANFIESTPQELSDYLNGKKGIGFRKLLRLSYLLYPESQKIVMQRWCLRLGTTESIKQSFEYASITRDKELLKSLIEKHGSESGVISKCVSVYTILYNFYSNVIGAKDIPKELKKVGSLKDELYILGLILKCYNYYYKEKYHTMLEIAHEAEELIYELSDRNLFIKECFLHRIAEVLGNVGVYMNDKEATRYYANVIISADLCAKTVSDAYYLVGMTYITEDGQRCLDCLQLRYEISKEVGDDDIIDNARRDLDFAKLYLGIKLNNDSDDILIRLQENKGSEFELKLIKEAFYQQGDDDFLALIEAMAHGTVSKLNDCRINFVEKMNFLFGSLAALEMKKLGERHFLLDEQIEKKHEIKGDVEFEENYIKCFISYRSHCRSSVA